MKKIVVSGGNKLYGEVNICGMKNAALPVIFSTVLVRDVCVIDNVPPVGDVNVALEILSELGARIRRTKKTQIEIDTTNLVCDNPSPELVRKMRASVYLLGAELGRFGKGMVSWPGGCDFGTRPIDYHLKGFSVLGAECVVENGTILATAKDGLVGNTICLPKPSVGATVNIILASVLAEGTTIIENAAREPHIIDVAEFLNSCGADIRGAGTSVIKIRGVKVLHGTFYKILPDMIEAGSYMAAVASAGGMVTVRSIIPKHLEAVTNTLREMDIDVQVGTDWLTVRSNGMPKATHVTAIFYPGFPTDMHPQIAALMAIAEGTSSITENVFDHRFRYIDQFRRLGAKITGEGRTAIFTGTQLTGAQVEAVDLRAGVALIIAGLAAKGDTEITNIELIERGYYNIISKFKSLGADIRLVYCDDEPVAMGSSVG